MSLLGEISKNSEALRYHAKTAEIAGIKKLKMYHMGFTNV